MRQEPANAGQNGVLGNTGVAESGRVSELHGTGYEDPRDDRMLVANVGPWAVVEGNVRGQSIVALGKVVEDELLQMVQSALESRAP